LLVHYDTHDVQLPHLVQCILAAGGFSAVEVDAPIAGVPALTQGDRIRAALGRANDVLRQASTGRLDMRATVPGALVGLGLLRLLGRRPELPQWYDFLFWSFVTFVNLNPPKSEPPWDVPGA